MSLNTLKLALSEAFHKLGTSKNGKTQPPTSTDNRFSVAMEYFVADRLASMAAKRKEQAKDAAFAAGVLEKPEEGTTEVVYKADGLQIIAKTKTAAERLDKAKLKAELIKEVGGAKADKIIKAATTRSSPATEFEFVEG